MDVEELLEPISDEMPCGEEGSLFALEEIIKEQGAGIVAGTEVEASEPNWSQLLEEATSQFAQCKHLRTALFLTLAAMNREGVTGFRDGLSLIKGLIERYWDTMYPELDPDESMGDPDGWMERENILNDMSAPLATVGDAMKFLQRLRAAPLTNSRQLGRFSLKDIQAALAAGSESGDSAEGGDGEGDEAVDAPKMSLIQGAFEDTEQDELEAMHQGVSESLELLDGIKEALSDKLSQSIPPTFDNVVGMLQDMHKPVHRELDRRGFFDDESEGDEFGDGEDGDEDSGSGESGSDGGGGDMASAGINTRQDVLKAFGLIYKYYSNNEPSSPVPLIMKRAERLVTASFMDIISDLSPSAMGDVETVTGGSSAGMMDSDDFGSDSSGDDDDM
jgi:type VI secretion system protein ImpA